MIINKNWLCVYSSPDAGEDAGGASTTGVQTDNTDNADTSTTATDSDAAPAADDNAGGEVATGEETDLGSQTVPDTYADFVMPEGVELDSALLTEAAPLFKELGLTQDQAQKLVDFQAKQVQASSESNVLPTPCSSSSCFSSGVPNLSRAERATPTFSSNLSPPNSLSFLDCSCQSFIN